MNHLNTRVPKASALTPRPPKPLQRNCLNVHFDVSLLKHRLKWFINLKMASWILPATVCTERERLCEGK